MVVKLREKTMELTAHRHDDHLASSSSSTKLERKVIEKNRRNQMKNLYSQLNSLLPTSQSTKEAAATSLPDQIDEAISYIKSMEAKLKKLKDKKESLTTSRKRSYGDQCCNKFHGSSSKPTSMNKSPELQIREMGTALEVVLTSGLDNESSMLFQEMIRILHEEGVEVVNASFSAAGNSTFHTVHAQMKDSSCGFGAARVSERLKRLIYGSVSEPDLEPQLWEWDFEIHPDTWGLLEMKCPW